MVTSIFQSIDFASAILMVCAALRECDRKKIRDAAALNAEKIGLSEQEWKKRQAEDASSACLAMAYDPEGERMRLERGRGDQQNEDNENV